MDFNLSYYCFSLQRIIFLITLSQNSSLHWPILRLFRVIIIKLWLNLDIIGLKIASRTNLEYGPRFAKVWFVVRFCPTFLIDRSWFSRGSRQSWSCCRCRWSFSCGRDCSFRCCDWNPWTSSIFLRSYCILSYKDWFALRSRSCWCSDVTDL